MGASVFVCNRGGTIVTCAATTGYMIEYDNRHLWMKLKTIKGSHFSNYREAWAANQLVCEGKIVPPLSAVYPLDQRRARPRSRSTATSPRASSACSASPRPRASASTTPTLRAAVGEERLTMFRRHG